MKSHEVPVTVHPAQRARFVVDAIAPGPDPTRTLKRYILAHDPHGDYLGAIGILGGNARQDHDAAVAALKAVGMSAA